MLSHKTFWPALVASVLTLPVLAQDANHAHGSAEPAAHSAHAGHASATDGYANEADSTRAYRAANDRMHAGMDTGFTGNADVDFARGMIPHHQGAIDMAKIQLQYGSDPQLRKLAEEVIAAQEQEVAFLQQWLERNGAAKP